MPQRSDGHGYGRRGLEDTICRGLQGSYDEYLLKFILAHCRGKPDGIAVDHLETFCKFSIAIIPSPMIVSKLTYSKGRMELFFKTFADFAGSNGLTACIEGFMLAFFAGAVITALLSCLIPALPPGAAAVGLIQKIQDGVHKLAPSANFTHGSTIVAGLVLTASTGVLGRPADIKITTEPQSFAQVPAQASQNQPTQTKAGQNVVQSIIQDPQREAFKKICAWTYVILGMLCFIVWVVPTPVNHDLVRNIGLTTLGFATSIISNLQLPVAK